MTLENSIQLYLKNCKNTKKLEDLTLKAYSIDLQQFLTYMQKRRKKNVEMLYVSKKFKNSSNT